MAKVGHYTPNSRLCSASGLSGRKVAPGLLSPGRSGIMGRSLNSRTCRIVRIFLYLLLITASSATWAHQETTRLAMLQSREEGNNWTSDLNPRRLKLKSEAVLVVDQEGRVVYAKNEQKVQSIASITKLMSAMVILDSGLPLDEKLTVRRVDRDLVRLTGSRLEFGARLTRGEFLQIALMASDNRAAHLLGRTYPGGIPAFVEAMNQKARGLGMLQSRFADPAGLKEENQSTAQDLARMIKAARGYPEIRQATTRRTLEVRPYRKRGPLRFGNTNRLLGNSNWEILLSKTGYINEAGRCIVMQARIAGRRLTLVFLNSFGKLTPFGDANRLRRWLLAELSN